MWSTALWHQALWENLLPVIWPTCTCNTCFVHFESKSEFNPTHYVSPSGAWISCYGKRNCLFFHNTRRTYLLISILRPHPPPPRGKQKLLFLQSQKLQPIHLPLGRRRYQAAAAAETAAYHHASSGASISSVSCQLQKSPACQTRAPNTTRAPSVAAWLPLLSFQS